MTIFHELCNTKEEAFNIMKYYKEAGFFVYKEKKEIYIDNIKEADYILTVSSNQLKIDHRCSGKNKRFNIW